MLMTVLAALALTAAQDTPAAAKSDLKVELKLDAPEYVIGAEAQAEVTLTNTGSKNLEIATPVFESRSVSFDITLGGGKGKPGRTFRYAVTAPDPHIALRLPLPRITLKPSAKAVFRRRIPTLIPGRLTIQARFGGAAASVLSGPVNAKVNPRAEGASKLTALFATSSGTFEATLEPEIAPLNVANFVTLARQGFYDNMIFHRVVKGGWIQSGCPYGNGYGGPGYTVKSEASLQEGEKGYHDKGTLAMSGHMKNDYTGSQFFITMDRVDSFDRKFTVIGRVAEAGFETLGKIESVPVDRNTDRPSEDVQLNKVTIVVK